MQNRNLKITECAHRLEGGESTNMDVTVCLFAFLEENSHISACLRKLAGC